jgi:phosphinothricin acetyltransferase
MPFIRLAKETDAESILEIYGPYIQNTSFTFETEVPSLDEFKKRIQSYLENWPWLVCEINKKVAGYAYASKHRERIAYQWCTECSVYVHDEFQRMGVAKALYTAIIDLVKLQGFRNLYAVINLPNEKSVLFHEQMGFQYFATYKNVGYKLGRWKNVGWWELQLNEYNPEPESPRKFSELEKEIAEGILKSAERFLKLK